MNSQLLWVEKYRPRELEDMILSDEHRAIFSGFLEEKAIPHLLLAGPVGSGKTSLAKILTDNLDCASIELNASDERGIDTMRNRVKGFLAAAGLSPWRIVFLDEADALTLDAQNALRVMMERFSERGRFIFTVNHREKIIDAIQSRCQVAVFQALDRRATYQHCACILEAEAVRYKVDTLLCLIDNHYPDVRAIVNRLQMGSRGGELVYVTDIDVGGKILAALKGKDLRTIREIVISFQPDFTVLYRMLFDSLVGGSFTKESGVIGVTIGHYMQWDSQVADREINFAACCLDLMKGS